MIYNDNIIGCQYDKRRLLTLVLDFLRPEKSIEVLVRKQVSCRCSWMCISSRRVRPLRRTRLSGSFYTLRGFLIAYSTKTVISGLQKANKQQKKSAFFVVHSI